MADSETNPKNELSELTAALAKKQQDSAQVTAEIEAIKSRITDLAKITAEIDQKVTAYEKARTGLDEQRKKSEAFFNAKKQLLENTLPNEQEILEKKNNSQKALEDLKGQLEKINNQMEQKQNALNAAQKDLDKKKAAYADELDRVGSVSKALKDLQELEKQADQEGDNNNFARMYFFVLEMQDALKASELPTPEAYRSSLERAARELGQASAAHRTAKGELDSAIAEQKAKQKELEEAAAARRQNTVASVPAGVPTNV